ncbi:uncharacterized protein LOC143769283 isoform X1 [Ranitomeya variabilis]|uniref:uncharacterized protein LOC143769283 isoform X1 n=2 Tax=Ranitomeya variabilis TaxID=490064 RepID=UPI00405763D0
MVLGMIAMSALCGCCTEAGGTQVKVVFKGLYQMPNFLFFIFFQMSNRVEFIRDFIEIYHSFPCLWKIKSPEYCNREKRKEGYSKLIDFYKLHAPEEIANEAVIKKKIQALRTVWRKELDKVLHTTRSGASTEDVYVPKLWYFEHMNFLRDQEVPRTSTCLSLLAPAPAEEIVSPNLVEQDSQWQQEDSAQDSTQDCAQDSSTTEFVEAAPARTQGRLGSRKRKATADVSHELVSLAKQALTNSVSPALQGFGHYIVDKLAKMDDRQRTLTERLILEAVHKGSDGNLDEHTRLVSSWPMQRTESSYFNGWAHTPRRQNLPVSHFGPPPPNSYTPMPSQMASPIRHQSYGSEDLAYHDL